MGSSLCCCCRSDPYPPKVRRKEGETWVLRYRVTSADGRRVEHIATVGLVWDFPKDRDAWREVDRLGLGVRIDDTPAGPGPGDSEVAIRLASIQPGGHVCGG